MNIGKKIAVLLLCVNLCTAHDSEASIATCALSTLSMSKYPTAEAFTNYDKIIAGIQISSLVAQCAGLYLMGNGFYGACTSSLDQAVMHKVLTGLFLCTGSAVLYTKARPWIRSIEKILK